MFVYTNGKSAYINGKKDNSPTPAYQAPYPLFLLKFQKNAKGNPLNNLNPNNESSLLHHENPYDPLTKYLTKKTFAIPSNTSIFSSA